MANKIVVFQDTLQQILIRSSKQIRILAMQLTPIQRNPNVVNIYFGLAPRRSRNRAEATSKLAAESKGIEISESGVKKIIQKWRATSNF